MEFIDGDDDIEENEEEEKEKSSQSPSYPLPPVIDWLSFTVSQTKLVADTLSRDLDGVFENYILKNDDKLKKEDYISSRISEKAVKEVHQHVAKAVSSLHDQMNLTWKDLFCKFPILSTKDSKVIRKNNNKITTESLSSLKSTIPNTIDIQDDEHIDKNNKSPKKQNGKMQKSSSVSPTKSIRNQPKRTTRTTTPTLKPSSDHEGEEEENEVFTTPSPKMNSFTNKDKQSPVKVTSTTTKDAKHSTLLKNVRRNSTSSNDDDEFADAIDKTIHNPSKKLPSPIKKKQITHDKLIHDEKKGEDDADVEDMMEQDENDNNISTSKEQNGVETIEDEEEDKQQSEKESKKEDESSTDDEHNISGTTLWKKKSNKMIINESVKSTTTTKDNEDGSCKENEIPDSESDGDTVIFKGKLNKKDVLINGREKSINTTTPMKEAVKIQGKSQKSSEMNDNERDISSNNNNNEEEDVVVETVNDDEEISDGDTVSTKSLQFHLRNKKKSSKTKTPKNKISSSATKSKQETSENGDASEEEEESSTVTTKRAAGKTISQWINESQDSRLHINDKKYPVVVVEHLAKVIVQHLKIEKYLSLNPKDSYDDELVEAIIELCASTVTKDDIFSPSDDVPLENLKKPKKRGINTRNKAVGPLDDDTDDSDDDFLKPSTSKKTTSVKSSSSFAPSDYNDPKKDSDDDDSDTTVDRKKATKKKKPIPETIVADTDDEINELEKEAEEIEHTPVTTDKSEEKTRVKNKKPKTKLPKVKRQTIVSDESDSEKSIVSDDDDLPPKKNTRNKTKSKSNLESNDDSDIIPLHEVSSQKNKKTKKSKQTKSTGGVPNETDESDASFVISEPEDEDDVNKKSKTKKNQKGVGTTKKSNASKSTISNGAKKAKDNQDFFELSDIDEHSDTDDFKPSKKNKTPVKKLFDEIDEESSTKKKKNLVADNSSDDDDDDESDTSSATYKKSKASKKGHPLTKKKDTGKKRKKKDSDDSDDDYELASKNASKKSKKRR